MKEAADNKPMTPSNRGTTFERPCEMSPTFVSAPITPTRTKYARIDRAVSRIAMSPPPLSNSRQPRLQSRPLPDPLHQHRHPHPAAHAQSRHAVAALHARELAQQ